MEAKENIQEKRVKSTIIRRRRKAGSEEERAPKAQEVAVEAEKVSATDLTLAQDSGQEIVDQKSDPTGKVEIVPTKVASEGQLEQSGQSGQAGQAEVIKAESPGSSNASDSPKKKTGKEKVETTASKQPIEVNKHDGDIPVGTIIKLPGQNKPEAGQDAKSKTTENKTDTLSPEKKAAAAIAKKKKNLKNIGGDMSEYGSENQIRRVFTQDRVFQPSKQRRGKPKRGKRDGKKTLITIPKASKRIFEMDEEIIVSEFAHALGLKAKFVLKNLMNMDAASSIDDTIDFDTATLVAQEFEWEVKRRATAEDQISQIVAQEDDAADLKTRAPIVTVMGHVDHGKTSLLDYIRNSKVTAGEAGGITQHIGAYSVSLDKGDITFIDTPGHAAFTSMRARGAQVTDIVILVVAADDGVMPQTVEAIDHAQAAGVPIIVAVNKIDKEAANPDRVKKELSEKGLVPEDWGGDTIFVHVSAITGEGVDQILDMLLLQSELLELKANPDKKAQGTVIEAKLDKFKGALVTVLIKEGTLKQGDPVLIGEVPGKVRLLTNYVGETVKSAGPSQAVEILGLPEVPEAGDQLIVLNSDKDVKVISNERSEKARQERLQSGQKVTLADLFEMTSQEETFTLQMLVKGDVQGSVEALCEAFHKLSTDRVKVNIIRSAVGGISESDIMLASASGALIIAFNVRPETKAIKLAEKENVEIKSFSIIYDATDTVKKAMAGLLPMVIEEKYLGRAVVRQVFEASKLGKAAGCFVEDGVLKRNASIRLLRNNVIMHEGKLDSLRRFKDDAKEVKQGFECGLGLVGYSDLKEGDVVESFIQEEKEPEL